MNGGFPVAISTIVQPSDHMSACQNQDNACNLFNKINFKISLITGAP